MPEKEGDDEKKSTKSVVNKRQKQMMGEMRQQIKIIPSGQGLTDYSKGPIPDLPGLGGGGGGTNAITDKAKTKTIGNYMKDFLKIATFPISRRNVKPDPTEKFASEEFIPEEGYDIARDMGKVRPSKKKKDATTMPVSKEMKKTQKVNKGPSALERVKAKYGKAVMKVGKKKANEELDLTQVAEAFGGYIIESNPIIKKSGKKTIIDKGKGEEKAEQELVNRKIEKQIKGQEKISIEEPKTSETPRKKSTPSLTRGSGFGPSERINPDDEKTQQTQQKVANQRIKTGKKQSDKAFTSTKTDTTTPINPKEMQVDDQGNIILNAPDQTPEQKKRFKQTTEYQTAKKRGEKPLIDQDKFSKDTRTIDQDRVTRGSGDGRKAGRRGKTVTYSTFTKKPEVTGGKDRATDTRSSVYIPKPEEIEKIKPKPETKPETKRQRNKRVRTAADQIISDIRTGKDDTVKTQTQMGDGEPPKPPNVTTSTGASGDTPKKTDAFSSIKKFSKKNPQIAAAGALAGYDLGKGILSKIMNLRGPGVVGGRAGFRSAGR